MYDYFYGPQADQFNFIRIPAVLFSKEEFRTLSAEAKVLYGILLKRMDLSAKNGWFDEQGQVFIICTLEEIMETMNCANQKAVKLLAELEEKSGLIERRRQGLGKPNLIYVKNFLSADNPVDNEPASHFKKCEIHTSGDVKITALEVRKSHGRNKDNNRQVWQRPGGTLPVQGRPGVHADYDPEPGPCGQNALGKLRAAGEGSP